MQGVRDNLMAAQSFQYDGSSYLRLEPLLASQEAVTGTSGSLLRGVEPDLLDERLIQLRRRQLQLLEETTRKLERLNESLDRVLQEQDRQRAALPTGRCSVQ